MKMTDEDEYNELCASYANEMLDALQQQGKKGTVTEALTPLINRAMRSVESLTFLFNRNPNDAAYDGAMILRGIYDAHLQALYILKDPESRARLYLDFYWVEWDKLRGILLTDPSSMAKQLMSSPRRAASEVYEQARFDAVKQKYLKRPAGTACRNTWYEGTLAELAKAVGYEAEYSMFSLQINGVVHSSVFSLKSHPTLGGRTLIYLAWTLVHRTLVKTAEHELITLTPELKEAMAHSNESFFHMESPLDFSTESDDEGD
jgi:hypothetical protein